jgi:hypothetical protein
MARRCPDCGHVYEDVLVRCPECKAPYSNTPRQILLTPEEHRAIVAELWGRLWTRLVGGLSVLTLISLAILAVQFLVLWKTAVQKLESVIENRVSDEFRQDTIRKTVEEVAGHEATSILEKEVAPALEHVQSEARSATAEIEKLQANVSELATPPTLSFEDKTDTAAIAEGLRLTVAISPSKRSPIGPVVINATLPRASASMIVDVHVSGYGADAAFLGLGRQIAEDGKTAVLRFQPQVAAEFWFHITVSEPETVVLSGSSYLRPKSFEVRRP